MCLMSIQLGRISLAKSIFSMKKMKKTTKSLNVSQTPRHNQKLNIFFFNNNKKKLNWLLKHLEVFSGI